MFLIMHQTPGILLLHCLEKKTKVSLLRMSAIHINPRKLYDYVQYDLKEIAFPSSFPDPPPIKKRRKLTWHERLLVARLYNESAQMSPEDVDVHIVLGVLYNLLSENDKAIASFKTALKLKPNDYSLWNKLGATQANSVQSADAILAYQQALDLKPNYVRAWANMGISYANQYCVQFKMMKIAVEGCMHGDLDKVYDTIKYIENTRNIKIDLLLCYGDFQAVKNRKDMDSLYVAPKYREMKSFWKYYSGQEVAPVPMIFIGGNNEASNYLWELYYGGWAAPNIYFLGMLWL
ncbi:hypothetical protein ES332_A04G000200v1 [Gossypium tomentosum]|uniref:Calcineurin-like phosphoesterase domain-containing protein n=2 Tax=Gossypium tomentosum TaxID=34277 RepID=A0A5D2QTA0_GOSTO|nr:hypothetical protein ES332_A04G000200v1 [Gossypium tomentosum]